MILVVEPQPAGAELIARVEENFSPTGILSRAENFEYRQQQQEMAVAHALQSQGHPAVEASAGVNWRRMPPANMIAEKKAQLEVVEQLARERPK